MSTQATLRSVIGLLQLVPSRYLAASLVVLVGLSLVEGVGVLLLLPLLALVGVESGGGDAGGMVAFVRTLFESTGLPLTLGAVLGVYVGIVAVQSSLQRAQAHLATRVDLAVVATLRRRLYEAISRVRWEFFVRCRSSDFLHVLTDEVSRTGSAAYYALDLSLSVALAGVYLALAVRLSPLVTGLVLAIGLVVTLLTRDRFRQSRTSGERFSAAGFGLHAAMAEHLASMKTVRAYGADGRQLERVSGLMATLDTVRLDAATLFARSRQVTVLTSTGALAVIVYVSFGVLGVPAAELLVLLFVFARLMPRLTSLNEKAQVLIGALPAFHVVSDLERRCRDAAEPSTPGAFGPSLERAIRMDRVTFRYEGNDATPAVVDLDLTIDAGSTTAIVGPSGAGKSTIADLLLGLLTPQDGQILIDGQRLEPESVENWRRQIGYVPQEPLLFHATVRENLQWACPEATDAEIREALGLAAADVFVAGLPRGLDTVVGDRGALLSGGERQRLSLARALLRRPRLLILDEATSSLDSENEARIQKAIEDLHARMTIVVITHRLPTIRSADLIHVVEQGRVVESGTWRDLTSRGTGRFLDLCRAQGLDDALLAAGQPLGQAAVAHV